MCSSWRGEEGEKKKGNILWEDGDGTVKDSRRTNRTGDGGRERAGRCEPAAPGDMLRFGRLAALWARLATNVVIKTGSGISLPSTSDQFFFYRPHQISFFSLSSELNCSI
jgi:hypothetical protein